MVLRGTVEEHSGMLGETEFGSTAGLGVGVENISEGRKKTWVMVLKGGSSRSWTEIFMMQSCGKNDVHMLRRMKPVALSLSLAKSRIFEKKAVTPAHAMRCVISDAVYAPA